MKSNLPEQITRLYERDQKLGAKAVLASDLPISYEAITVEWLTNILCGKIPGAKVTGLRLGPPDDATSNRRHIYLDYNQAGVDASLPVSVFCKASHSLINRLTLGLCGSAHAETMFYNNVRNHLIIDSPRAYFADYDRQSFVSIVILEDMANDVQFATHTTEVNRDKVESMVRLMASYHAAMHEKEGLTGSAFELRTLQQFWQDIEDLVYMEESSNTGFLAAKDVIPSRLYSRFPEIWPATKRAIALHDQLPKTLIHNDVHLRNWYVRDSKTMGLMDWGACCVGNWSRDFAYGISVALSPDNRRKWEKELLKLYLSEVKSKGIPVPSFDEAWLLYIKQLLPALAFWTNTLRPSHMQPENMQPEVAALEFIRRIACAIDDHEALDNIRK